MEEEKENIGFIKTKKPSIPEGFFNKFHQDLMDEIKADMALSFLKKNKKPSLPKDYFNTSKIELDLDNEIPFKKHKRPAVPNNFFETFEANIATSINEKKEPKKNNIFRLTLWSIGSAAAAAIILGFILFNGEHTTESNFADNGKDTLSEENIDSYMAYLDESTIIDYYIDNDIELNNEIENEDAIIDIVSDDIEEWYLDM